MAAEAAQLWNKYHWKPGQHQGARVQLLKRTLYLTLPSLLLPLPFQVTLQDCHLPDSDDDEETAIQRVLQQVGLPYPPDHTLSCPYLTASPSTWPHSRCLHFGTG